MQTEDAYCEQWLPEPRAESGGMGYVAVDDTHNCFYCGKPKEDHPMSKIDALIAAHKMSRETGSAAYAVNWPVGGWAVSDRKPSLHPGSGNVILCEGGKEFLA